MTASFRAEADGPALPSRGRYGAGEAHYARVDTRTRERVHASTCLAVVVSGGFDFSTPAGAATVTAGSMIFGHAGEQFSYRYLDRRGARRSVIALSEELVAEVADHCGIDSPKFPVAAIPPRRATAALYGLARRIAVAEQSLEEDVLQIVAAAMTIGRIVRTKHASTRERGRIRDVARYIDAQYASALRLDDMATMAQLSRFHFLRAFTSEIGESPGRYLNAARLRAAADRLIDNAQPIASIALDVGFNDLSHFNATFRATYGASPSAWRRAAFY